MKWGLLHATIASMSLFGLIGGVGSLAAQEVQVTRQPWDQIYRYVGDPGLSPLYDEAGKTIGEMLSGTGRWYVLPPAVSKAIVSPEKSPCFEMHSGDGYYNNQPRTAQAIRYANSQSWEGRFRLFYNTSMVAGDGNEFWLRIDGFRPVLTRISGDRISEGKPIGALSRSHSQCIAVNVAKMGWCFATDEGPFSYVNDSWQRLRIPGWPGGEAHGVATNPQGQLAVWADLPESAGTFIARLSGENWVSTTVPDYGPWTCGAIRSDGKVLLAGPGHVLVVPLGAQAEPREDSEQTEQTELRGLDRQRQLDRQRELARRGHAPFSLDDGRQVMVLGMPAVHPAGTTLFVGRDMAQRGVRGPGTGHGVGLVRILADGNTQWFDMDGAAGAQLATWPEDGFMISVPGDGIFRLAASDARPMRVGDASEVVEGSRLLGGDQNGRAYFDHRGAILAFNYKARRIDTVEPEWIADLQSDDFRRQQTRLGNSSFQTSALVDGDGNCWFVGPDGSVRMCRGGSVEPRTVAKEVTDAVALWPGRDGALLVVCDKGRVALILSASEVFRADSLKELAVAHPVELNNAAPLVTCDERQQPYRNNQYGQIDTMIPWLSTGKSLWLTDGSFVYRTVVEGDRAARNDVQVEKVCQGAFDLLGPLGSGNLLLAKRESAQRAGNSTITSWYGIEDAEGKALLQGAFSPSREAPSGVILENPSQVTADRLVDRNGHVVVHGGFDRVFRSNSYKDWQLFQDFGVPRFEFPAGYVWGYHNARVFPGYEVVGDGLRRSCLPTYREHLTPLFGDDKHAYCLTPLGISVLRFDPKDAEADRVIKSHRVEWPSVPLAFVGHVRNRVFMLVGQSRKVSLVVAELPPL